MTDSVRDNKPLSSMRVFIDSNFNGRFDRGEPTDLTNALGQFAFHTVAAGPVRVGIIPPLGYTFNQGLGQPEDLLASFDHVDGTSTALSFDINLLRNISGVVFEDINGNGVQDDGEPGLRGVKLYIDENGDGLFEYGETRANTGRDGKYRFHNVDPTKAHRVTLFSQSFHLESGKPWQQTVVTQSDAFADHPGIDFAVVSADVEEVTHPKFVFWAEENLADLPASARLSDADADADGFSNFAEYIAGSDALDAASTPLTVDGGSGGGSGDAGPAQRVVPVMPSASLVALAGVLMFLTAQAGRRRHLRRP